MTKDSFLTERQIQILELRYKGMNQTEIAKKLGTTRANISSTEKTARDNIKKAHNTLKVARMIESELIIKIEKETDLTDLPRLIYEKAGTEKIWVNLDTPSLIGLLNEDCKNKIKGRRIVSDIEVAITKDGDIIAR